MVFIECIYGFRSLRDVRIARLFPLAFMRPYGA